MNLEELADQVIAIDTSKSRADILRDLEHTKCVETTINRIFDGQFLQGVKERKTADTLIILDSSDEEEEKNQEDTTFDFDINPYTIRDSQENVPTSAQRKDSVDLYTLGDEDDLTNLLPLSPLPLSPLPPSPPPPPPPPPPLISLDSLEELSSFPSPTQSEMQNPVAEPFSYELPDNDEGFVIEPKKDSRKRKASIDSISIIDSDSEGSLPSVGDLFGKLMSRKEPDRKGKRRAYEFDISSPPISSILSEPSSSVVSDQEIGNDSSSNNSPSTLSAKEKRKLETEQRKRAQAEERNRLLEEKKQKKLELQEEKKRAKEQKLLDKERATILERENRLKNDRVQTIKEMIVDIHPDFVKTTTGQLVKLLLEKKETPIKLTPASNSYHVSWRRVCKSEWDANEMMFVPFANPKIVHEPYAVIFIDVYEFVNYIKDDTIDAYIDTVQSDAGPRQLFMLVEGLQAYYRKKINHQRRVFDEQVRSTIEGTSSTTASRRKNEPEIENGPDQEQVESCIDHLILERGIMFLTTKKDEDSATWIESLTTDLAIGRYKSKNSNSSYKVGKRGSEPTETFSNMLQEIQLCTPAVAKSVLEAYPTMSSLKDAFDRCRPAEAELLLADLDVDRSTFTARDRKINRVMAKKIYRIFNSTDPNELIR